MRSVVMALAFRTWADGLEVGYAFSPDRISVQLRDDGCIPQLLLANPYRSRLGRLSPRRRAAAPTFSTDPSRRLVQPYRWRRREPRTIAEAERTYRRLDRWLQRRVDPAQTVLVTSHPVLAAVADRAAWSDVTYYAWDDFRGVPGMHEVFDWAHREIARKDVNLVAVTEALVRLIGTPRSTVVPNGILASEYDEAQPVPDWYAALPGRIAFYAGSLQHRIDVGVLLGLVRDLGPEWTLVLVGPMQEPEWFTELSAHPQVVIRGREPRERILSMMAAADVCLVPHIAGTEDMSPLKVYEYLGAGAPVVATDLEPMRGLSDRCLLVPPGKSMTEAVLAAAELPPAEPEEVAAFRARHDWSARYADWRRAVLGDGGRH